MHHTDEVSRFQVEAVIIHLNISKYHESLLDELEVEKLDEVDLKEQAKLPLSVKTRVIWSYIVEISRCGIR